MAAKRQGSEAVAHAAKRAKALPMLDAVVEGLAAWAARSQASASSCSVLAEMAKGGLGTPSDERHEYQAAAVRHVEQALQAEREAIEAALLTAEGGVATAEDDERRAAEAKETAEEQRGSATAAEKVAMYALAAATRALLDARARVKAVEAQQAEGSAKTTLNEVEAALFSAALSESLPALRGAEAPEALQVLLELAGKMSIDKSLVTALMGAGGKKPEDRSSFDTVALAAAAQEAAVAAVQEAAASEAAASAARSERAKLSGECAAKLDLFKSWTWACFETLRDRVAKKEAAQCEETSAPGAEETPYAMAIHEKAASTYAVGVPARAIAVGGQ